jgi:hypothetical protein
MHNAILDELVQERVVSSRGRHNPRAVKKSVGRYPIRARCTSPPTRTDLATCAKLIK